MGQRREKTNRRLTVCSVFHAFIDRVDGSLINALFHVFFKTCFRTVVSLCCLLIEFMNLKIQIMRKLKKLPFRRRNLFPAIISTLVTCYWSALRLFMVVTAKKLDTTPQFLSSSSSSLLFFFFSFVVFYPFSFFFFFCWSQFRSQCVQQHKVQYLLKLESNLIEY